jgi:hypothetical protein
MLVQIRILFESTRKWKCSQCFQLFKKKNCLNYCIRVPLASRWRLDNVDVTIHHCLLYPLCFSLNVPHSRRLIWRTTISKQVHIRDHACSSQYRSFPLFARTTITVKEAPLLWINGLCVMIHRRRRSNLATTARRSSGEKWLAINRCRLSVVLLAREFVAWHWRIGSSIFRCPCCLYRCDCNGPFKRVTD